MYIFDEEEIKTTGCRNKRRNKCRNKINLPIAINAKPR